MPTVRYAEQPPPAALAPFVRDVWAWSTAPDHPDDSFTLPPDPCLSLVLIAAGPSAWLRITGPHLRPLVVLAGAGAEIRGVRLRLGAVRPLLGLDPPAWPDRNDDARHHLPDLAGLVYPHGVDRALALLVDALSARAASASPPDALVREAVAVVESTRGEVRVDDLSRELCVSVRTLQRRFRAETGLAPKAYARVRRFLLAAANVLRAEPEAWGRVAAEHGYADQAHFARECAALTGVPPTVFAERMLHIEHIDVKP